MPEDDPKIVELVLKYLYKLDYNDDEIFDAASEDDTLDPTGAPAKDHLPPSPSFRAAVTGEQESIEDEVSGLEELEGLEEPEIGMDQKLDLQRVGAFPPATLSLHLDEKNISINDAAFCKTHILSLRNRFKARIR